MELYHGKENEMRLITLGKDEQVNIMPSNRAIETAFDFLTAKLRVPFAKYVDEFDFFLYFSPTLNYYTLAVSNQDFKPEGQLKSIFFQENNLWVAKYDFLTAGTYNWQLPNNVLYKNTVITRKGIADQTYEYEFYQDLTVDKIKQYSIDRGLLNILFSDMGMDKYFPSPGDHEAGESRILYKDATNNWYIVVQNNSDAYTQLKDTGIQFEPVYTTYYTFDHEGNRQSINYEVCYLISVSEIAIKNALAAIQINIPTNDLYNSYLKSKFYVIDDFVNLQAINVFMAMHNYEQLPKVAPGGPPILPKVKELPPVATFNPADCNSFYLDPFYQPREGIGPMISDATPDTPTDNKWYLIDMSYMSSFTRDQNGYINIELYPAMGTTEENAWNIYNGWVNDWIKQNHPDWIEPLKRCNAGEEPTPSPEPTLPTTDQDWLEMNAPYDIDINPNGKYSNDNAPMQQYTCYQLPSGKYALLAPDTLSPNDRALFILDTAEECDYTNSAIQAQNDTYSREDIKQEAYLNSGKYNVLPNGPESEEENQLWLASFNGLTPQSFMQQMQNCGSLRILEEHRDDFSNPLVSETKVNNKIFHFMRTFPIEEYYEIYDKNYVDTNWWAGLTSGVQTAAKQPDLWKTSSWKFWKSFPAQDYGELIEASAYDRFANTLGGNYTQAKRMAEFRSGLHALIFDELVRVRGANFKNPKYICYVDMYSADTFTDFNASQWNKFFPEVKVPKPEDYYHAGGWIYRLYRMNFGAAADQDFVDDILFNDQIVCEYLPAIKNYAKIKNSSFFFGQDVVLTPQFWDYINPQISNGYYELCAIRIPSTQQYYNQITQRYFVFLLDEDCNPMLTTDGFTRLMQVLVDNNNYLGEKLAELKLIDNLKNDGKNEFSLESHELINRTFRYQDAMKRKGTELKVVDVPNQELIVTDPVTKEKTTIPLDPKTEPEKIAAEEALDKTNEESRRRLEQSGESDVIEKAENKEFTLKAFLSGNFAILIALAAIAFLLLKGKKRRSYRRVSPIRKALRKKVKMPRRRKKPGPKPKPKTRTYQITKGK